MPQYAIRSVPGVAIVPASGQVVIEKADAAAALWEFLEHEKREGRSIQGRSVVLTELGAR